MRIACCRHADDGVSPHLNIGERARTIPKISKSDEAFAKECIDFVWGYEDINTSELNDLFERVRSQAAHPRALHSPHLLCTWPA